MPSSRVGAHSRTVGVLVATTLCAALAGCAGPADRLPECRSKPVPINSLVPAVASKVHVSASDAH